MRADLRLWCLRLFVSGCLLAASLGVYPAVHGQPPQPEQGPLYFGADVCARCHTEPRKSDKTDYVLLTEYKTWSEEDKHSQAFKVLQEPRSKEMGRLLGIADVTADARCLNC